MSTKKLWKFGSSHGWTLVVESSSVIAAQVVKGQAIRTTTVPSIKVEFGQETREYTTTDADIAERLLEHPFCGTKFWAVKGFPRLIEGRVKEVSTEGPEPTRKQPVRVITSAKGTGSFNEGPSRVKQKVG